MRGVLREVDRIPSWFIIVSANDHPRVIPLPAREGRGWALELLPAASLWAPPPRAHTPLVGRRSRRGRFLPPLDISLLFLPWGRATFSTRETSAGKGEWAGWWEKWWGVGVLSCIRSLKTIRYLSRGDGGAWGGKPRWVRAEGKQAQV